MSINQPSQLLNPSFSAAPEQLRTALTELLRDAQPISGAVGRLLPLVVDRDEVIRDLATELLDRWVQPTAVELGVLMQTLRETTDGELEYWAATLVGRLGPQAAPATGLLATVLLDSACLAARERAAWALSQIGPAARAATNSLRQIGHDDPPRLQRLAQSALTSVSGRTAA